ncbi:WD repeat protein Lub1, partial [Coemansia sp. RSA 1933]
MEHLDTVTNFITTNADGVTLGADQQQQCYADPFTGASRYVPGQQTTGGNNNGSGDPFTGSSRYTPGGTGNYVPPTEYVIGKQGNVNAIIGKLAEFNGQVAQDKALSDAQLQSVRALEALGDPAFAITDAMYAALLHAALGWPSAKRFPALDLLRLTVAHSPVPARITQPDGNNMVASIGKAAG